MQVLRLPPRHHPKAEIVCPPMRWRAVSGLAMKSFALALLSGGSVCALLVLSDTAEWRQPRVTVGAGILLAVFAGSAVSLAHANGAAREPVVFKVARGELTVSWPFLLSRRTRAVRTSDVTAVVVSAPRRAPRGSRPTGRLAIKRRHRRSIRVPGLRPLDELNRAAEELRSVLHV